MSKTTKSPTANETFLAGWLGSDGAGHDTLNVKRVYFDINDNNLHDAILFSQIMYWHGNSKETGRPRLKVFRDGHLWLAKPYDAWWKECRINARTARRCIDRIKERGLIHVALYKFDGSPTVHVRIDYDAVGKALMAATEQSRSDLKGQNQGYDLKGQNEMTSEVKSITETTTETKDINIFTADAGEDTNDTKRTTLSVYEQHAVGTTTGPIATTLANLIVEFGDELLISIIEGIAQEGGRVNIESVKRRAADLTRPDDVSAPPVKVAARLKPYFDAIRDNRPLSFTAPGSDGMILNVAKKLADTLGIEPDDIAPLYAHVVKLTATWTVQRTINTLVSHAPDYIEKRNARARASEQRAAAPDEPIDYDAMLSASLDRASLYEATGD